MTREDALSDLDYVRTLAEEGRSAPLLGGAHLVGWGVLIAAALVGHWAAIQAVAAGAASGWAIWGVWGAFGLAAGIMSFALSRRLARKPGLTAVSNRADSAIWLGASLVLTALAIGQIGHMLATGDVSAPNAIPPAAFAVYGGAMLASSIMSGEAILRASGLMSAAFGLALGVFADQPWMYLAAAAGALAVLSAPGLLLLSREPRSIV